MIDNKYYTPDISEFYVGFEYEQSTFKIYERGITGNFSVRKYDPTDFIESDGEFFLQEYIDIGAVRVKYLDKSDVEELGFTVIQEYDESYKFKKGDITLVLSEIRHIVISIDIEGYHVYNVFRGIIKNKSELKKLLKTLNINA